MIGFLDALMNLIAAGSEYAGPNRRAIDRPIGGRLVKD